MDIQGTNISLRSIDMSYVSDNYVSWMNDKEVISGLQNPVIPYTKEMLSDYIQSVIKNSNNQMFAIIDNTSGKHIGNIKLIVNKENKNCELGILIGDKNFWGKGVGQESCKLLVKYAFNDLNLSKVWLAVHANNNAAIRLYEKIGFQTEGVFKKHIFYDGQFIDKVFMAIFPKT